MSFSERAKLTALAIVHIFETSKPFGDYGAVAVLRDGAGVSYGINQFTHRSGSLALVIAEYLRLGGQIGRDLFQQLLPELRSGGHILRVSENGQFKTLLRQAAKTSEMRQAQQTVAFEKYLKPAIDACEGSDFVFPLSLAVVYDSINHGSFAKIRDRVVINKPGNGSMKPEEFEKAWITRYVQKRDYWLEHHTSDLLQTTDYRTDFFLAQIARGNWNLELPLNVQGHRLTDTEIDVTEFADLTDDEINVEIPVTGSAAVSSTGATGQAPTEDAPAETPASDLSSNEQPPAFVPGEVSVDAPPPTGFMAKLKAQGAALLAFIGGGAGLKEWFGVKISPETVDLLKVLLPTVLTLGFAGFLAWFIAEKVIGFKTLKLQANFKTDPTRHDLNINAQ